MKAASVRYVVLVEVIMGHNNVRVDYIIDIDTVVNVVVIGMAV